jgi:hypothetical protein
MVCVAQIQMEHFHASVPMVGVGPIASSKVFAHENVPPMVFAKQESVFVQTDTKEATVRKLLLWTQPWELVASINAPGVEFAEAQPVSVLTDMMERIVHKFKCVKIIALDTGFAPMELVNVRLVTLVETVHKRSL